jgi:hypothetical protein
MDEQLAVSTPIHDRTNGFGGFGLERAAWGNNSNAHGQRLWMEPAILRNGGGDQRVRRLW